MTPSLAEWIENTMRDAHMDLRNLDDIDCLLLSKKSLQKATQYGWMTTFGNYFCVVDKSTKQLVDELQ